VSEGLGQLATAHIDRIHPGRITLQQQIREPTRGRPDVQADQPDRFDTKDVQGGAELQATPRNERRRSLHFEGDRGFDEVAGLAVRPRSGALADAHMSTHDQRLGARASLGETSLDEQLVESLSGSSDPG